MINQYSAELKEKLDFKKGRRVKRSRKKYRVKETKIKIARNAEITLSLISILPLWKYLSNPDEAQGIDAINLDNIKNFFLTVIFHIHV